MLETIRQFTAAHPVWSVVIAVFPVAFIFGLVCDARHALQNREDDRRRREGKPLLYHLW